MVGAAVIIIFALMIIVLAYLKGSLDDNTQAGRKATRPTPVLQR